MYQQLKMHKTQFHTLIEEDKSQMWKVIYKDGLIFWFSFFEIWFHFSSVLSVWTFSYSPNLFIYLFFRCGPNHLPYWPYWQFLYNYYFLNKFCRSRFKPKTISLIILISLSISVYMNPLIHSSHLTAGLVLHTLLIQKKFSKKQWQQNFHSLISPADQSQGVGVATESCDIIRSNLALSLFFLILDVMNSSWCLAWCLWQAATTSRLVMSC